MSDGPKVFFTHLREMTERFDPRYHSPVFANNLLGIRRKPFRRIGDCCELSDETWDKASLFHDQFPYIEIGAINTELGETTEPEILPTSEAPSRAQMVVRRGDILVSMTRPTRNAIARVSDSIDVAIASTGFAVVRKVDDEVVLRDYFFHVLRFDLCTIQFDQRCSGGNYPAITKDDFRKTIIAVPSLDVQKQIVEGLDAAYAAKRKADENATRLLSSIDDIVLSELGIPPLPPQDDSLAARMFFVPARQLAEKTLAPSHYFECLDFSASRFPCRRFSDVVAIDPAETNSGASGRCSFVPMDAVSAEYGRIEHFETVEADRTNGYSCFRNGDVIWAKITPCMENGKSAVVESSDTGLLFGSTEFMVFRPRSTDIDPRYLHCLLRLRRLRQVAARHFTGSSGHQRVTGAFFAGLEIPVPPLPAQHAIAAKAMAAIKEAKQRRTDASLALETARKNIEAELIG